MKRSVRHLLLAFVLSGVLGFGNALTAPPAQALNTLQIAQSTMSTQCMEYSVVGVCAWLYCSWGCTVRTSVKVKHYVPDLVVSSYENTGENPWTEIAMVSPPLGDALAGGFTNEGVAQQHVNTRFKNVDAIGHPGAEIFNRFASQLGFFCRSGATGFMPYFVSTLDALAWRSGVPEMAYPEALIPGRREMGQLGDLWSPIYPRSGFVSQTHDYKTAATAAQRAADVVTRNGQVHVYQSLTPGAEPQNGWWPPSEPVLEGDASTHKWQMLAANMTNSCAIFPDGGVADGYGEQLDEGGDYAWTLWRPYSCCQKRGQTLLYHTGG